MPLTIQLPPRGIFAHLARRGGRTGESGGLLDQPGDQHGLRDTIAGLAKMNNTSKARHVIAEARDLLGGNGILLENHVIRHMADIEAIHTFEGTETIQTLIVGRDITGVSAFT
jgi:glutaryl-CoA dehydrogenase